MVNVDLISKVIYLKKESNSNEILRICPNIFYQYANNDIKMNVTRINITSIEHNLFLSI